MATSALGMSAMISIPLIKDNTWILAQGFGSSTLGIGYSLNFHKGTGQDGTSYDVGVLARPARFLSLALVGKSLNHPTVRGVELRRQLVSGGFIGSVSGLHQEIRDGIVKIRQSGKPVIA